MLAQGCISGMHAYQKIKYRNNIKKIYVDFLFCFVFLKVAVSNFSIGLFY